MSHGNGARSIIQSCIVQIFFVQVFPADVQNERWHLLCRASMPGIALSELIHALEKLFPPQEKIDKAKQAVEVWIEALTLKPKLYRISRMRATPAEFIGEAEDEEQDWRSRTPPRYATSSFHAVTNFRV